MKTVLDLLEQKISDVMRRVSGQENCSAFVRPATDAKFGDYQVNGIMGLAKRLKTQPRTLAEEVVTQLDLDELCETPEVAGPGFINLRLKPAFVGQKLQEMAADTDRLGIVPVETPQRIVVDFSSPNVAKQMHVGHLRSTIIGDAICRMLEFAGHKVIRQNHIGDWGTQFGMLLAILDEMYKKGTPRLGEETSPRIKSRLYEDAYKLANERCGKDAQFARESRDWVVKLQEGDSYAQELWEDIVEASLADCQQLYDRLSVKLEKSDVVGESHYNDLLPAVVQKLKAAGLAEESDGAMCVFPEGFKNKEGEPLPFIIQKSDGAYLYATTDLAAIRYRVGEYEADRIVYVTDARQKLHFEMLFAVARKAGWAPESVELSHVMFGTVLGDDGTPLKTRSGENVKLKELLDEAVERARDVVNEKNPDLSENQKNDIARAVGIGAVKYADYSNNRTSDYVFNFDRMLAMDGNTAPYMQYAYARVQSIGRKAEEKGIDVKAELDGLNQLSLTEPSELDLAKHLIRYGEAIESALADYRPNYLTAYLYELAQKFSGFYTNCPVLTAGEEKRATRLLLCELTAGTIKHGLTELLGIDVVDQM